MDRASYLFSQMHNRRNDRLKYYKYMIDYQGVIIGQHVGDFVLGSSSPIKPAKISDGNWSYYKPEHEKQNRGFETYACTLFSGLDCLETLFMYYLHKGWIPADDVNWLKENGYFKNGYINFSDRYPAQFADIEIGKGTYQYKANNSILDHLIPEDMMSYDNNNYYDLSKTTPAMEELAKEFKRRFYPNWYWVEEKTEEALKSSPLQAVVPYADGAGILCPKNNYNHAIMIEEEQDYYLINDSYTFENKRYCKERVTSFVGFSLTLKTMIQDVAKWLKDNDLKFVRNSNTGAFARVLQNKLRTIKTDDRGTLLLLDEAHRKNGVTITDSEWASLPSEQF
jgi:hypothetical protein